jgi:hypothetical protein
MVAKKPKPRRLLEPWPEELGVPITRRDVRAVLAKWDAVMPARLEGLLAQPAATPEEERALLEEGGYAIP